MDKKQCGSMCEGMCGGSCEGKNCGGMCMHGCHSGKHHLVKIILKLIIVILIFWCGFKLGEMTGFIRAETGRGFGGQDNWGMMGRYYNTIPAPNANNATPTP